jgi:hypothetical protein
MKTVENRINVANLHGGGVLITTLIFIFGDNTPLVLKVIERILAYTVGGQSISCHSESFQCCRFSTIALQKRLSPFDNPECFSCRLRASINFFCNIFQSQLREAERES